MNVEKKSMRQLVARGCGMTATTCIGGEPTKVLGANGTELQSDKETTA